jgi:site-specific DNA recombinase
MSERKPHIRCAIYTRKSSEEGLEQEFNSLHAQREACEAYIRSQAHEGWRCLPERFDDGGHSGGTIERPALQRLIADVQDRKLDVIVLYKIDRLTRSLADFARLAELFDRHAVSFVSVTQQFNTTTSMGRLMLNVLLSFAQFEREITGERIRDKIAASKKKGIWMGGVVPLGYDARDRQLVVNPDDAETVRSIFNLYLERGTVPALADELVKRGIHTRSRTLPDGRQTGNRLLSRGHLYQLLSNPIYIGRLSHKGSSYPGLHQPIIDQRTWETVQTRLDKNAQGSRTRGPRRANATNMLSGLLVDEAGNRFIVSHTNKAGRRYRYYISRPSGDLSPTSDLTPRRVPAAEIEQAAQRGLHSFLSDSDKLAESLRLNDARDAKAARQSSRRLQRDLEVDFSTVWNERFRTAISRVVLSKRNLTIVFDRAALSSVLGLGSSSEKPDRDGAFKIELPITLRNRGAQLKLVLGHDMSNACSARQDPSLVRALVRAHTWFAQLANGEVESVAAIAKQHSVTGSYVSRVLRMAFLSPKLVEQILTGTHPVEMTVDRLTLQEDLPLSWRRQHEHFTRR